MLRYALVIFLLCQITVGCVQRQPAASSSSKTQKIDNLETRIYQRLSTDPATARLKLRVQSSDGIVTLSGRISEASERLRAVSIVRATPGVRAVIDKTRRF